MAGIWLTYERESHRWTFGKRGQSPIKLSMSLINLLRGTSFATGHLKYGENIFSIDINHLKSRQLCVSRNIKVPELHLVTGPWGKKLIENFLELHLNLKMPEMINKVPQTAKRSRPSLGLAHVMPPPEAGVSWCSSVDDGSSCTLIDRRVSQMLDQHHRRQRSRSPVGISSGGLPLWLAVAMVMLIDCCMTNDLSINGGKCSWLQILGDSQLEKSRSDFFMVKSSSELSRCFRRRV